MNITISEQRSIDQDKILTLYEKNKWCAADKPDELFKALNNSHSLVTAWDGSILAGLGNAISDGYLVVYYPHLLVLPEYQGKGIGKMIMNKLKEKYSGFHQQILISDPKAVEFYKKSGFKKASLCTPMWIYKGNDHA